MNINAFKGDILTCDLTETNWNEDFSRMSQQYLMDADEDSQYSDSESEKCDVNVTELYRRKPSGIFPSSCAPKRHQDQRCCCTLMPPPPPPADYHYHCGGNPPQFQRQRVNSPGIRSNTNKQRYPTVAVPPPPNRPHSAVANPPPPMNRKYYTAERRPPHRTASFTKKYPVAVKTPRYSRYNPFTLCKKPTNLCIPAVCQTTYRQQELSHKKIIQSPKDRSADDELDGVMKNFDDLLLKFDDENLDVSSTSDGPKRIYRPKAMPPPQYKPQIQTSPVIGTKQRLHIKNTDPQMITNPETVDRQQEQVEIELKKGKEEMLRNDQQIPYNRMTTSKLTHLDDNGALELHQSKCYIVNLIDKALSKELGTVCEEQMTREFMKLNPKKVTESVKRHCSSQTNYCTQQCESEPFYLKQLKQLRWGHIHHIQRETKRLADVERLLDTFVDT